MSLYDELQQDYKSQQEAMTLQLNLLARAAGNMVASLPAYLGIPSARWNHHDGKAGDAYVRLGEGPPLDFKDKSWMNLSSKGGVVSFSVAVTIVSEDRNQRVTYVFEMDARFCDHGYRFALNDVDYRIIGAEDVKAEKYQVVHQMIFDKLKELLDPKKIVITV